MDIFNTYFKELKKFPVSEVTEHTYRAALQNLLNALRPDKKIDVLHEPKRKEQGAPDYKVMNAESIIGYVENKKIEDNLSKTAKSKQIEKYKTLSDNILLTNYIEWIWIKDGKLNGQEVLCFEAGP